MTAQKPLPAAMRTAAVIGADPAGLTAALGLLDAGFDVALYSDRDRKALCTEPRTHMAAVSGALRRPTAPAGGSRRPRRPARPGTGITFDGYVGVTVAASFEAGDRITTFLERGGALLVETVTPESLGAIAATTDLTLVAPGRGVPAGYFPPDRDRPVHRGPAEALQGVYVVTRVAGSDRIEPKPRATG
ncbi:hypothetical protein [Nocardia sp. X0981]